jgi:hypothetical protein
MKKVHRIHMDTPNKMALMALPSATACAVCKVEVPETETLAPLCSACSARLFKEFDAKLSGVPVGSNFELLSRLCGGPIKTDVARDAFRRWHRHR